MFKKLTAALILLLALASCGQPARKAGAVREERRTPELLAAVPSDALAVVYYDELEDGLPLYDSTSILHQLDLSAFKRAHMALSLCYNGSLVPVLAVDAGRTEADSVSAVNTLLAQAGTLRLHAEYIRPDKEAGRRGFVLITPSDAQMTAVRRHLTEYTSILDAPGFRQALALTSGDFVIFRNNGAEHLAPKGWLKDFFPRRELTAFLGTVADWTVFTPEAGGFGLQASCGPADSYFANVFASLPTADSRLGSLLPADTRFALALPVHNPELREAVVRFRDASVKLTKYNKTLEERKKESGKDPLKWEKELDVREVALVHFGGGAVTLVRPAKAVPDAEASANAWRGILPALYGSAFALSDDSFTAAWSGWYVYGSEAAVCAFLEAERPGEESPIVWPGKGCRFVIYEPDRTLAWGKKGIKLLWNTNQ